MKKPVLSFLIILLACMTVFAQVNTFSKQLIYKYQFSASSDYNTLKQTNDKGYITCRMVIDSTGNQGYSFIELIKLYRDGNLQWVKRIKISNNNNAYGLNASVVQARDKGFLLAMAGNPHNGGYWDGVIVKTDSNGVLVWAHEYQGAGACTLNGILQTQNRDILVWGTTSDMVQRASACLFLLDSAGNWIWGRKCSAGTDTSAAFISACEQAGQGFVAAGFSQNNGIVARFDLNGNLSWGKCMPGIWARFNSVIQTADTNFLIMGSCIMHARESLCMAKLDLAGDVLWAKNGYDTGGSPYYNSIIWSALSMNAYPVFAGYINDPIPALILGSIDLNGNLYWSQEYRSGMHSFSNTPVSIDATTDGGFITSSLVGTYKGSLPNFSQEILKTDSQGRLSCDGQPHYLGLENLSMPVVSNLISSPSGFGVVTGLSVTDAFLQDTILCENIQDPGSEGIPVMHTTAFSLAQNFPNPFEQETTISYQLSQEAHTVELEVQDLPGATLFVQKQSDNAAGEHRVILDAGRFAKGIYLYTLRVDGQSVCKKMIVQ